MNPISLRRIFPTALALALVTGCAVGPVYKKPSVHLPSAYAVQLTDDLEAPCPRICPGGKSSTMIWS